MLYIHYCKTCNRIHMLNGHKTQCPKCSQALCELPVSFLHYAQTSDEERRHLIANLKE